MKNKIVAGNWKMNLTFSEAEDLLTEIGENIDDISEKVEVIVCVPYPYLEMATDIEEESNLQVGAQNCSQFEKGAFTGEVSAEILESLNVGLCIVGHSERRKYFNETNDILSQKVKLLLKNDIVPIFCVGETIEDRTSENHFSVIEKQMNESLFDLSSESFESIIIAYEPVWAIGTGVTATAEQAQEMHEFIRNLIAKRYNQQVAEECFILYGGSCNPSNAELLFSLKDVDGGLIGGASLKSDEFLKIIEAAEAVVANN